jgi:hypothetical protein
MSSVKTPCTIVFRGRGVPRVRWYFENRAGTKRKQMKIKLPNPIEFDTKTYYEFFDQLELSVYHARKSFERTMQKYSTEDIEKANDTPYIVYNLPNLNEDLLDKEDPNNEQRQEIEISIVEM